MSESMPTDFAQIFLARRTDLGSPAGSRTSETSRLFSSYLSSPASANGEACLRMRRAKQNCLFVGSFDFDAMGFDGRIVFQRLMDDAAVKCAQRFEFDDV